MALYGSVEGVQALLRSGDDATFSDDEDDRITALQGVASLAVERETGAIFYTTEGVDPPEPPSVAREQDGDGTPRLYLDLGVRSVASIVEFPAWVSGAWTGGMQLTTSQFRLTAQVANGAYRVIERMDGAWSGTVLVTGVWEDSYTSVPADIDYATNRIAAEIFKSEQASPHGLMGPEGAMVPVRKAMQIEEVRKIIDFYRVGPGMWVVG